jgi:hypothetical protein
MLFNQTVAWRPASFIQRPSVPKVMSQAPAMPALTPGVKAIALTIAIAMGAATAWVGLDTGARRTGLLSILGYVVGIGGGLSAAIDLVGLGAVAYQAMKPAPAPGMTTNPV